MFTARVEHDISPNVTLRNTTRFGRTTQDYMLTSFVLGGLAANGTVPAANTGFLATPNPSLPATWTFRRNPPTNKDQENKIFVNQTNVTAKFDTGGISHSISAGLELLREEQNNLNFFAPGFASVNTTFAPAGSWPDANLYNPNPDVVGYNRLRNGTGSNGRTDTVGLYAFDTIKLNEQWQITGGLRYDHYSTDFNSTALALPSRAITPTSLSVSDGLFTGKLGVVYKPAENGSVYAAYGTAAQPPGGANFALAAAGTGNNAGRTDFLPQKAKTYEVGTKWDVLNKRLALTAALYRTEVRNEVVQDPTNAAVFTQTGKKRVQGIELGAAGAITDNWGVSAGFTTMNTKVDGSTNSQDQITVAPLHAEAGVHGVDDLPVSLRPDDRRRRPLQRQADQGLRRRRGHPGLHRVVLGVRRDGVLSRQQERRDPAEHLQPVRQGVRGGDQQERLSLRARHPAFRADHGQLHVLTRAPRRRPRDATLEPRPLCRGFFH